MLSLLLPCVAPSFVLPSRVAPLVARSRTDGLQQPTMGFFDIFFGGETLIDVEKSQVAPGYVEASHILLRSDESDAEADALLARIQSGEMSFGDAASEFSACPSRNKKGFLGQFTSLSSILFLPYEGKDTAAFDALVKSSDTQLKSPYKVKTSFGAAAQSPGLAGAAADPTVPLVAGTHLVVVESRGS